ncbi:zinc finger protein 74 isoform X2 [Pongo abelii]|uniref:zinc finger protein 74 isoform X2 n=1 Tax=Pongo abelii TaxID=9601 RepID=UPI0030077694
MEIPAPEPEKTALSSQDPALSLKENLEDISGWGLPEARSKLFDWMLDIVNFTLLRRFLEFRIGEFQGCGCGLHPGGVGSTRLPSEGLIPGCDVGELPEPSCPRTSTAQARCDLSSGTRRGAMEHAEGSPWRALSRMGAEGSALSTAGHLQRRTGPGAHHGAAPGRGAGVGAPGRCSAEESGCALGARTCHGLGHPCRGIPPQVSPLRPATRSRGGTLAVHTQERPGH